MEFDSVFLVVLLLLFFTIVCWMIPNGVRSFVFTTTHFLELH